MGDPVVRPTAERPLGWQSELVDNYSRVNNLWLLQSGSVLDVMRIARPVFARGSPKKKAAASSGLRWEPGRSHSLAGQQRARRFDLILLGPDAGVGLGSDDRRELHRNSRRNWAPQTKVSAIVGPKADFNLFAGY